MISVCGNIVVPPVILLPLVALDPMPVTEESTDASS